MVAAVPVVAAASSNNDIFINVQRCLADTFTPSILLERDNEKEFIISFINKSTKTATTTTTSSSSSSSSSWSSSSSSSSSSCCRSLYICGCPGSGKSLTLRLAIDEWLISNKRRADIININAMSSSIKHPIELFTIILRESVGLKPISSTSTSYTQPYGRKLPSTTTRRRGIKSCGVGGGGGGVNKMELLEESIKDIIDVLNNKRKKTIIVIDEIDSLRINSNNNNGDELLLLRLLFEMSTLCDKITVIGISNTIDIIRRLNINKENNKIDELIFKPYTHKQLKCILKQRINNNKDIIQEVALDLACRRVAAIHGDCRKVLDVCRRSIIDKNDDNNNNNILQTIKILDKCYGGKDDDDIDKIIALLPFQQQMVLASCLTSAIVGAKGEPINNNKNNNNNGVYSVNGGDDLDNESVSENINIDDVRYHLNKYINDKKLSLILSREVFHDHIQAIASTGLISIIQPQQQQPTSSSSISNGGVRLPPIRRKSIRRQQQQQQQQEERRKGRMVINSGADNMNDGIRIKLIAPVNSILNGILSYNKDNHHFEHLKNILIK